MLQCIFVDCNVQSHAGQGGDLVFLRCSIKKASHKRVCLIELCKSQDQTIENSSFGR